MSLHATMLPGVADDPALPTLAEALDPRRAAPHLAALPGLGGPGSRVEVLEVRVLRYKPGRRCVIGYTLEVEEADGARALSRVVGKIRRGRRGASAVALLRALRAAGFGDDSADGISVPEPLGMAPGLSMWLQRGVVGRQASELLSTGAGVALGTRIADAADKLHRVGVPSTRRHAIADEIGILRARLGEVAEARPRWRHRVERLLEQCLRLARAVPPPATCGIHRDYYAEQVVVDGERLYLMDFDLYCEGDPALDVGNFIGHVREQALRTQGDPGALLDVEWAAETRFAALAGRGVRPAVQAYAGLTLARLVHISTVLPGRGRWTGALLDLAEEAVAVARAACR